MNNKQIAETIRFLYDPDTGAWTNQGGQPASEEDAGYLAYYSGGQVKYVDLTTPAMQVGWLDAKGEGQWADAMAVERDHVWQQREGWQL